VSFSIGVIGLGRIAQAIILPLLERGKFNPKDVFSVVGSKSSVEFLRNKFPKQINVVSVDDPKGMRVWESSIQLLAVKPNQLESVLEKVRGHKLSESLNKPLLVSVLAGVNLQRLEASFPQHICVRAVPNTPSLVSQGLTGLSWGNGISSEQQTSVKDLFNSISEVYELPEDQMDAFLALTSSGPAYVALITEALSDGAVAAGLPRALANDLAKKTIAGTVSLLTQHQLHPAELKDMVASPGGTTIAALRHLEKAGLRSALMEAVLAAASRSRELA